MLGSISLWTKITGMFLLWGRGPIRLVRPSLSLVVSSKNLYDAGLDTALDGEHRRLGTWFIYILRYSQFILTNLWLDQDSGSWLDQQTLSWQNNQKTETIDSQLCFYNLQSVIKEVPDILNGYLTAIRKLKTGVLDREGDCSWDSCRHEELISETGPGQEKVYPPVSPHSSCRRQTNLSWWFSDPQTQNFVVQWTYFDCVCSLNVQPHPL